MQKQILAMEAQWNENFIDREEEIRLILLGMLSRKHVLLLGPPGTTKSGIVNTVTSSLELSYFRQLMNQFSTPDEIFGPVDIKRYKEDGIYSRITKGKAADSEILFLDEVFKAGPSILNALLSLMEERIYDNGDIEIQAPVISIIGASNEMPSNDDGLEAFYDRFLLRRMVVPLQSRLSIRMLIKLKQHKLEAQPLDLTAINREITQMEILVEAMDSLSTVWEACRENEINVSDRRLKQAIDVMAADSWLRGHTMIQADSIIVCKDIMWSKPEDAKLVEKLVRAAVNPDLVKALEIQDAARTQMNSIDNVDGQQIFNILQELKVMMEEVEKLNNSDDVKAVNIQLDVWTQQLMKKMMEKN